MNSSQDDAPAGAAALQRFYPLRRAEEIVLLALREGDVARVGLRRPLVPSIATSLRGAFVSFLARGGTGDLEAGRSLQIMGAWIEGRVDLHDATVAESIWFYRCVFDATPRLDGARVHGSATFSDCLMPGLRAEDSKVADDFALNSGTTVRNEVRLARALIGRHLDLSRARLRSAERSPVTWRRRVTADAARIGGNVMLGGGFEADGEVSFAGARIGGSLRADGARLSGQLDASGVRGVALTLERSYVAGSIALDAGFAAAGTVDLTGMQIDGDLRCSGADFDVYGEAAFSGARALLLDRARVGGTLAVANLNNPLAGASLLGTRAGALLDDASSWGDRLVLDGFRFRQFAPGAPTAAATRLQWLALQEPSHLDLDFRPGPWRELIAVLRRMGHHESAREVAVARERHLSRIGRVAGGASAAERGLSRLAHGLLGALAGYGYRPARVVGAMAAVWLGCGALYVAATQAGALSPAGIAAQVAPPVRPFVLSLDLLLPIVDLQQESRWAPLIHSQAGAATPIWQLATRAAAWFEVVFGWIASLVLIGALAGLFDRDQRERRTG